MIVRPLYLITDINAATAVAANGGRVVVLDDYDQSSVPMQPRFTTASMLLPPYEAVYAGLDGNMPVFANTYAGYLSCKEPMEYIYAILLALIRGIEIVLYTPPQKDVVPFIPILLDFIATHTGLIVGTPNNHPSYDSRFDVANIDYLLGFGMINLDEYMFLYPSGISINPALVPSLIDYYRPSMWGTNNPSLDEYLAYFNEMKDSIKRGYKTFGETPVDPFISIP